VTLLLVGLVGGVITGLSPCVLPVLPVVLLGGGAGSGAESDPESTRRRPYLVVFGLTVSFAVFTLFGALVLNALHLPDDTIRWVGLALLVLVGLGLLIPTLGHLIERPFARFPQRLPHASRNGFVLGIALGAVFVPCAGPVLAAITVAGATGHIDRRTLELTLGFAIGTAIPLLFFALAGRGMSQRLQAFRRHQRAFRAVSGVVMISLAVALTFNLADVIQRDVPDYTQAIGNHLEKDASQATSTGGSVSLQDCESAALYGGEGLEECGAAPGFTGIQQWFNTPGDKPLTLASLRGKVVLVDFWAYSCINCQRELVHVEAWAKNYAPDGLVVVGVQTPEYAFEHVPSNILAGARRLGLTFPIAVDDSYATWNAYDNQSWPADYLIDASGRIRHVSVGEGDYTQEEDLIRELLGSARPGISLPRATNVPDLTPTDSDQTPETYLGNEREQYYDGPTSYKSGTRRFTPAASVASDSYTLAGTWSVASQSIIAGSGAQLRLVYHASEVYLDVGGTGTLTVSGPGSGSTQVIHVSGAPNIYTVASSASATTGTVTIKLSPGLSAYSFTFG
jgi:cytochrome c biogenesis protein CcdA/thiol-disulfide isomerase/thioredoxin